MWANYFHINIRTVKVFLIADIICAAGLTSYGASPEGNVSEGHKEMRYLPVSSVRLTSGPFHDAQQKGIRYLLELDPDRLLAPYRNEAGLDRKAENYPNWENTGLDGHIGGHYLSALSYMYAATGNKEIGQRLDYMLKGFKECQDAAGDGYLGGIPGSRQLWKDVADGNIKAGSFDLNGKWVPLYNIHKTYAGLADAWHQAGRKDARDMLVKLADWMALTVSELSEEQMQQILSSEHGGLNEVFADVAVITGDRKYLDLAHRFSHKEILTPLVAGKDELTGKHANTQIPKVIGYKRIADIESNDDWNRGVDFFWKNVTGSRSVSIGGNSVREHFHPINDFSSMLESEQGPETCNTYNMLRLTKMMQESHADLSYTDYIERAMFNHILSAQNSEHGGFVYFTPMRPGHYRVYSQPQTCFWCCVGSGMENQGRYGEYIYSADSDNLYVNLFIPSKVRWNGADIELCTEFPEDNNIRFKINPGKDSQFGLNVRVPGWASESEATVMLNGKRIRNSVDKGYIHIDRKWRKDDEVSISYPISLSVEQLGDKSPNYSFLYGPIVLAAQIGIEDQTGLFADDSRGGHIAAGPKYPLQDMPVIIGDEEHILSYISKTSDSPLVFSLSNTSQGKMKLVPFTTLNECRYMIYWPLTSKSGYNKRQADIERNQAAIAALDSITLDKVICGEQQPESDHFIMMEESFAGNDEDRHWRRANKNGRFGYRLKAEDRTAAVIRVYYIPETGKSAGINANGVEIGLINTEGTVSCGNGIAYKDFPGSDSDVITVEVKASECITPKVCEIRLLRR